MLLQTNSYIVPKDKRAEHARLVRRFRFTLARLGCEHFEVYEQVGPNWSGGDFGGRFVQIMRFRDRQHQLAVNDAERNDADAQRLIAEFCDLINIPYQQQQGLFAIGFYHSVLPVTPPRVRVPEDEASADEMSGEYDTAAGMAGGLSDYEQSDEAAREEIVQEPQTHDGGSEASIDSETTEQDAAQEQESGAAAFDEEAPQEEAAAAESEVTATGEEAVWEEDESAEAPSDEQAEAEPELTDETSESTSAERTEEQAAEEQLEPQWESAAEDEQAVEVGEQAGEEGEPALEESEEAPEETAEVAASDQSEWAAAEGETGIGDTEVEDALDEALGQADEEAQADPIEETGEELSEEQLQESQATAQEAQTEELDAEGLEAWTEPATNEPAEQPAEALLEETPALEDSAEPAEQNVDGNRLREDPAAHEGATSHRSAGLQSEEGESGLAFEDETEPAAARGINGHPAAHPHHNGDDFLTDAQIDEALNEALKELDEPDDSRPSAHPPPNRR